MQSCGVAAGQLQLHKSHPYSRRPFQNLGPGCAGSCAVWCLRDRQSVVKSLVTCVFSNKTIYRVAAIECPPQKQNATPTGQGTSPPTRYSQALVSEIESNEAHTCPCPCIMPAYSHSHTSPRHAPRALLPSELTSLVQRREHCLSVPQSSFQAV